MILEKFKRTPALHALAIFAALLMCQPAFAYENDLSGPSGIDMTADLIIGRPVLLATTIVGTAVWLVALPFSALGGNAEQSADTLIGGPARATFVRCLGCNESSYKN